MRRYGACLGRLPALERQVLVLRAGLGQPEPLSRPRVAVLTSTSVARVARAERRGLHRLRALGHRGGCAVMAPATIAFATAGMTSSPLPILPAIAGPAASARIPHSGVKSEHASGIGEAPPTASSSAAPLIAGPAAQDPGGGGGGIDPIVVLVPLLLLGYLGWVVRGELRKP